MAELGFRLAAREAQRFIPPDGEIGAALRSLQPRTMHLKQIKI
jgi:hypothetical protein